MRDRIAGGLVGLLVGDALGVPYEFHDPRNLPPPDQIELEPPSGFRRSHLGVPPGTWSDDGAHALCLLASLLDRGGVDVDDLGRRLVAWWGTGYLAVDARPYDIGNQTSDALIALERGVPAERSGGAGERDNGNGSLMRVLPLALWHRGSDASLAADACRQSVVTHGHPRSQVCCALYCLWARRILADHPDPWADAVATVRDLGIHPGELDQVLGFSAPRGSGYVVDALHSARIAVDAGPYEVAVRRAIGFGLDTDTTACIAGGIAGLRDGLDGIPVRWRDALRGRPLFEPLLDRLLAIHLQ
ncbi:MAG: ADP-ribosylglycohydrolase family protein [Myxococcota bacterium]